MSRVGNLPVPIPDGVKVEIKGESISVTGPKGTLTESLRPELDVKLEGNEVIVSRPNDQKQTRAYHGLVRALIANMVVGVTQGYEKILDIEGVGYRASMKGKDLDLSVGHSHPVVMTPPEGITFEVDGQQTIKVSGIDKQMVGQVAANVRKVRKPEPYKGKGIRYRDEYIRRKEGKAAK